MDHLQPGVDESGVTDRPNLDRARAFTRVLGPAAMIAGTLIAILGLAHPTASELYILPLGLLHVLFGAAAYARTESMVGQLLRWAVVVVFVLGGGFSLVQWAILIWGSPITQSSVDVTAMGFYLMAGPALLVPAGLAVVRSGWVPLIVTPAIVSLSAASVLWHGTVLLQHVLRVDVHLSEVLLFGVVLCSTTTLLYSAQQGLRVVRQPAAATQS